MLEQFSRSGGELVMVRGHGSSALGQMLEEAFQPTSSLEASCKKLCLRRPLSPRETEEGEGKW